MLRIANVLMLLFAMLCLNAQVDNFSPFSRFGLGDLKHNAFASGQAMGGTGIGLRVPNQINHINPASYNAQDTLSFVFDVGIVSNFKTYKTTAASYNHKFSNLDHIALSFPITKWWYASAGLLPFSSVGYKYESLQTIAPEAEYLNLITHEGEGGLSQLYTGTAFKIADFLSLGVNANYTFGILDFSKSTLLVDSTSSFEDGVSHVSGANNIKYVDEIEVNDLILTFGLQAYKTFNNHYFAFGAIYEPKLGLKSRHSLKDIYVLPSGFQEIHKDSVTSTADIDLPQKLGFGLTYSFKSKILITGDYEYRDWSQFKLNIDGYQNEMKASTSLRFGIEYTPNKFTLKRSTFKSYIERVSFKAGVYQINSYINVNNTDIKDQGLSCGVSLPLGNSHTTFNISYLHGIRGTTQNRLVEETYNQIRIGLSLYDIWFLRSKYD